jgi:hypothetical protein
MKIETRYAHPDEYHFASPDCTYNIYVQKVQGVFIITPFIWTSDIYNLQKIRAFSENDLVFKIVCQAVPMLERHPL